MKDEALRLCDCIIIYLTEEDFPDSAVEFIDSVEKKTISIRDWVEKNNHATENQIIALENMLEGVERWLK